MPLILDYSKGLAIHRLYGHYSFVMEAEKANKPQKWIEHVCSSMKCVGQSNDWRSNLKL